MKRKKTKKAAAPAKLQPEKYIQTKARSLPLHECLLNPDWQTSGLATILVSRRQPGGNLVAGVYLVDVFCLGLKNTHYFFNEPVAYFQKELKDLVFRGQEYEPCSYVLAHNIIYGAIAYAEDLGFRPNKDFAVSRFVLEEDDDRVELLELEFGSEGKPCFVVGPYDNVPLITGKLRAAVGEGNFTVIDMADDLFGGDFGEEEEEEFDDYEEEFDDYEEVTEDSPATSSVQRSTGRPSRDAPRVLHQVSYTISHEPMRDERYRHFYEQLGDEIERLYALTAEKPKEAIPVLQRLIAQYPDFPTLQNYLSVAYQATGQEAEANELVEQMYHAFPDYLFARLNFAYQFLYEGDLDRVAEILENKFEIKQLYPEREIFHVSEILNFNSLVGEYLIAKGEPDKAVPYLDLLEKVDPKHPLTNRLALKLMATRLKKGFKKLFGK